MIYVDQLKRCRPIDETGGRWRWKTYCHLFSDEPFKHLPGCKFVFAATCAVGIECEHGFDTCPKCDPCKCPNELADFAARLKLKPAYYQAVPGFPHYDLTKTKRAAAVRLGAKEITTLELVTLAKTKFGFAARI